MSIESLRPQAEVIFDGEAISSHLPVVVSRINTRSAFRSDRHPNDKKVLWLYEVEHILIAKAASPLRDMLWVGQGNSAMKEGFDKTIGHRLHHAARLQRALAARHLAELGLFPGQETVLKLLAGG